MRGVLASLALAALLGSAAPAAADPLAEARAAYTSGAELAKQGRWVEARAEFRRSAALKPHPLTSYNLGYCELMLQSFVRARRLFREALRADGGQLSDEYRESAEEHLATAEARVARVPVTLPDGDVLLLVDDRPLEFETGGPPPVLVAGTRDVGPAEHVLAARVEVLIDPGPHRFVTRREGSDEEVARTISFDEGPAAELALDAPLPPEPVGPEGSGWRPGYVGAVVAGGLGLGFAIAGTVLAGMAESSWSDAEEACPDHAHCPSSEGPALSNEARDQANGATAAFVVGGAAIGAGVVLWLVTAATETSAVEARAGGWALRF